MDEWDVVRGIFQKHLDCGQNIQKALQWEASGHWYDAKREYETVLSSMDYENILSDYYIEALYKVCSSFLILLSKYTCIVDLLLYMLVHLFICPLCQFTELDFQVLLCYLLQCLAHLSDWDGLNNQVREQIENNWDQLWTDEW
jgi:hypothetical protein